MLCSVKGAMVGRYMRTGGGDNESADGGVVGDCDWRREWTRKTNPQPGDLGQVVQGRGRGINFG